MEIDFRDLAAKFDEEDGSYEPQVVEYPQVTNNTAAPAPASPVSEAGRAAAEAGDEEEEEEEEDDGWTSEDEDLASALEWADLPDGESSSSRVTS